MSIIAKNTTGSDIFITELGKTIPANSSETLTEFFDKETISTSLTLKSFVSAGTIVINDGTSDLSISDGLKHINIQTQWEDQEVWPSHALPSHSDANISSPLSGQILIYNNTSGKWENKNIPYAGVAKRSFTFGDNASDYIPAGSTTYTLMRSFIFEGTTVWTPIKFSVIASLSLASTGYFRLYDITNNLQICEIIYTTVSKSIQFTTTFTNLPTGEAIFEIQGKNATRTNRLHCAALF